MRRSDAEPSNAADRQAAPSQAEARLAALMAAAQDGDAGAYQRLLRACLPLIGAVARRQGVPDGRVDDVIQDVLLTLHRARHTYDPARPFLPWLRAIARRRSIDALRLHGRNQAREIHDALAFDSHPDPALTVLQGLEQSDRARDLREAVAALPEGQRQAVEELALRERSLDEAAASTGRSKGALKVNLHRALKALRVQLTRKGSADA